ncbi:hypothetical protein HPP92_019480 [Vanilla planifolia]|uniref:Uncharacterized protein n=1 Tax=Vanilla planifolia TaxID=51239 RepID=A0A835Q704_VANPL|nr:hypothetical protein HPP92_019480 [Vanilla planifolia]
MKVTLDDIGGVMSAIHALVGNRRISSSNTRLLFDDIGPGPRFYTHVVEFCPQELSISFLQLLENAAIMK